MLTISMDLLGLENLSELEIFLPFRVFPRQSLWHFHFPKFKFIINGMVLKDNLKKTAYSSITRKEGIDLVSNLSLKRVCVF